MNHTDALSAIADASGWRTSTRTSQGQNCVEVTTTAVTGWVGVRDSKNRTAGLLAINHQHWSYFIHAIRAGELD